MKLLATVLVAATVSVGTAVGATPPQHVLSDALHAMDAHGFWMSVERGGRTVVVHRASSNEAKWKAFIAAGVYAAHGFPLRWIRVGRQAPGYRYPFVSCACSAAQHPGPAPKVYPVTKGILLKALRRAVRGSGARLDRIELLHPLGYAPVVTVTAHKPRHFIGSSVFWTRAFRYRMFSGPHRRVEGMLLIVRDSSGHVVATSGFTTRSGLVVGPSFGYTL
jgi:hypothetical protein